MSEDYYEKAAIFIDEGYLNKILETYFNKPRINHLNLCEETCSNLKLKRLRMYFYHCIPIVRKDNKEDQIQHAILIAGDSDFAPAIKKAKDYGTIIHLYYHPSSVHNEILDIADELHKINEKLIDSCKIT